MTVEDIFCGEEREALLNQIVCEHFLRQGKLDIAESLSEVKLNSIQLIALPYLSGYKTGFPIL